MLQAIGAERSILAILMNHPQKVFDIDDVLTEDDFTNPANGLTYRLIREIVLEDRDAKVDQYALIGRAESQGLDDFYETTHNGELLEAIQATKAKPDTLGQHVNTVKLMTIKRNSIDMLEDLKDEVEGFNGDAIDLKNKVEDTVFKEMRSLDTQNEEILRVDDGFEENIHAYADHNSLLGLDIGFPRWQRDSGGIRNGTVTGLFARAKAGKSQFAAWCGVKAAIEQGIPTLYLDTELQLRQQQARITGILSGVKYGDIESGAWKASKDKHDRIVEAFGKVKDSPFFYKNIAGKSINYVIPIIRKFFYRHVGRSTDDKVRGFIIYDYLKLMNLRDLKDAQEWQVLGFFMSALHDVAAQLNIPILCLGQLNREAARNDTEYTVAGSDRIVHNVDSITLFREKKPEELDTDGVARGSHMFKIAVCRSGPGHGYNEWQNLHFDKGSGQFEEDKRNSEVVDAITRSRPMQDRLSDEDTGPLGDLREE